jgi:DNA-binding protein Fis
MDHVEKVYMTAVLRHTKGNISAATEILGWTRGTVTQKIKDYGVLHLLAGWRAQ